MRAVLVWIVLVLAIAPADASRLSKLTRPPAWVCALVRAQLSMYSSRAEAEQAALARGYSRQDIARAKLCL